MFLGKLDSSFVCRSCLSSYTSENNLLNRNQIWNQQEKTIVTTQSESHFHWRRLFSENPIFSRIYAVFEADNQIDKSAKGKKNN